MGRIKTIRDELASNPTLYDPMTDAQVAAELNALTKVGKHETLATSAIYNVFDPTEWAAIVTAGGDNLSEIDRILNFERVVVFKNNDLVMSKFSEIFGAGSITYSAIKDLRKITATRAAELGLSGEIRDGEVTRARAT